MSLEKELKYLLDKRSYSKLIATVRPFIRGQVRQENCYFDGPKLILRKNKCGLRIRILNDRKAVVTFKEPAKFPSSKVRSYKVRHEWETQIPLRKAKLIIAGKMSILSLNIRPIRMLKRRMDVELIKDIESLGSVKNLRTIVQSPDNHEWEIDKFKMFKKKFYELEVETEDPMETDRMVRYFMTMSHIPYHPSTKSKLGRFFEFWKKRN